MFSMLSNFKKKYIDPYLLAPSPTQEETGPMVRTNREQDTADDVNAERHWTNALLETIYIAGCTCVFCRRRSSPTLDVETGCAQNVAPAKPRRNHRRSVAPTNSIMQVLYPPSYLNTPLADPDPPAYFPHTSPMPDDFQERELPVFSSNVPHVGPDTASYPVDAPPSGIPVVGPPLPNGRRGRAPPYDSPLTGQRRVASSVGLRVETPDEADELPPYSRFDTSRPRFPAAPDILGPYPHISILTPGPH